MTTEIDWDNAPEGAEYWFDDGKAFYKKNNNGHFAMFWPRGGSAWDESGWSNDDLSDNRFHPRPQQKPKYIYGVEYPTNGHKPDLPDDVIVAVRSAAHGFEYFPERHVNVNAWELTTAFKIVDGRYKPAETAQEEPKPQNPYQRTIIGLDGSKCVVDVYRILDAFKTGSPALDHAVKKILCPGTRHAKTREQDLKEAIKSIESELLLMSQR